MQSALRFWSRPDGKRRQAPELTCGTEVRREGRQQHLVARCGSCRHGVGDLADPVCFAAMLRAFGRAPEADAIVTGSAVERQYGRRPLALVRALARIAGTLDERAVREPLTAYAGIIASPGAQRRQCQSCPYHPGRNLAELRRLVLADQERFFAALRRTIEGFDSAAGLPPVCMTCTGDSRSDLAAVFDQTEDLVRQVLRDGFSVVLRSEETTGDPARPDGVAPVGAGAGAGGRAATAPSP